MGAGIFIKNICSDYPEIDGSDINCTLKSLVCSLICLGLLSLSAVVGALTTTAALPFFWQPLAAFD
jgi:hypothetical protein